MDIDMIRAGLDALANAGSRDNCYLGHFGCGMLACNFLCVDDLGLSSATVEVIRSCSDSLMLEEHDVFDPIPGGTATPELLEQLHAFIAAHIGNLSRSGHVSIVAMFSLRALRHRPELVTPQRVQGIMRLIDAYLKERPEPRYYGFPRDYAQAGDQMVTPHSYKSARDAVRIALRELTVIYPDCEIDGTYYYFTGEKLHALTHAHALYELERIGEIELAKEAYTAHRLQVFLSRMQPAAVDPIEGTSPLTPRDAAFWRAVPNLSQQLGRPHALKRGYALLRALHDGVDGLDDPLLQHLSYILLRW